jgi:hypothetical protein
MDILLSFLKLVDRIKKLKVPVDKVLLGVHPDRHLKPIQHVSRLYLCPYLDKAGHCILPCTSQVRHFIKSQYEMLQLLSMKC